MSSDPSVAKSLTRRRLHYWRKTNANQWAAAHMLLGIMTFSPTRPAQANESPLTLRRRIPSCHRADRKAHIASWTDFVFWFAFMFDHLGPTKAIGQPGAAARRNHHRLTPFIDGTFGPIRGARNALPNDRLGPAAR
jgi:hypothetical protein